jgi:calcineurin-like phosphoesterase family protein
MKHLFYQALRMSGKEESFCFWSDTHFNHKCEHWKIPLWKARGFNSVEEHNEGLIQRWNNVSTHESTFFHLGDFIFGLDSAIHFKSIIRRLNFKDLYLMPGNHCSGWKQVFEEQKGNIWYVDSHRRVIFVPNLLEVHLNGQFLAMSHYPILSFNGQSKNGICIYGHVHGNLEKNDIGKLYNKARTLEVTIEKCPSPITFKDIKSLFKNKPLVSFDHHTQDILAP